MDNPTFTVGILDDHPMLSGGVSALVSSQPEMTVLYVVKSGQELLLELKK